MNVAVVAYDGFNELDVFANLHIVNRASRVRSEPPLRAELTCASVTTSVARHLREDPAEAR